MKVNISYSVDLDEVLTDAFSFYVKESEKLKETSKETLSKLAKPFSDDSLFEVLQAMKNYREASSRFDEKLVEISNILIGYANIRYKQQEEPDRAQETTKEQQDD